MTKKINVWGREFDLTVIFDCYKGEEILSIQEDAIKKFVASAGELLSSSTDIEKYCIERDTDSIGDSISNIFKYVIPTSLFVKRDEKKRVVDMLCNYRFDEEHGIVMTFENERLVHIGTQDDL